MQNQGKLSRWVVLLYRVVKRRVIVDDHYGIEEVGSAVESGSADGGDLIRLVLTM